MRKVTYRSLTSIVVNCRVGSKIKRLAVPILPVLMALCLLFPVTSFGLGLEVDPVEIVIQDCPLGEKVAVSDLGGQEMKLRIENKGSTAYTYSINVLLSSEAGTLLREGYVDIPDTSWIIPENKEVRIPAKSLEEVELYLEIPKLKEYQDKRYQAVIEVKSKKNRPEEVFVLAVQIRMCFSTRRELTRMKGRVKK